jgi:hypothetical protein
VSHDGRLRSHFSRGVDLNELCEPQGAN